MTRLERRFHASRIIQGMFLFFRRKPPHRRKNREKCGFGYVPNENKHRIAFEHIHFDCIPWVLLLFMYNTFNDMRRLGLKVSSGVCFYERATKTEQRRAFHHDTSDPIEAFFIIAIKAECNMIILRGFHLFFMSNPITCWHEWADDLPLSH